MKKPSILLLAIIMLLSCLSMDVKAQGFRYDVNKDGSVNITDAMSVIDRILHQSDDIEFKGEAIDLGLPSGLKWASYNVGATKPEEFGGYYSWGETWEKEEYTLASYKYAIKGSDIDDLSYILNTEYDVAKMKWGNNWRMPTFDEFFELFDYCNIEWVTYNGVNGYKFISNKNDNSIFIPTTGYFIDNELLYRGIRGGYWLADASSQDKAKCFVVRNESLGYGQWARYYGLAIRPVTE